MEELNDKLLKDYLTGRATARQVQQLRDWVALSNDNARQLFRLEALYHEGRRNPYADESRIMRQELRLVEAIRQEEAAAAVDDSPVATQVPMRRFWQYAAAIAAFILIGVGSLHFLREEHAMTEAVALNGVRDIILSDGTKVSLNAGTRLQYPDVFTGQSRQVYLTGEARFEVAKDPAHPFIVSSKGMDIKVLGTVFNFNTHVTRLREEVTLLEGIVEATAHNGEGKIVLMPDQKVILDKESHTMTTEHVYAPLETLWYSRKIPFRNMHITDIMHILEKDYGEQVIMTGVDVNATYSGVSQQAECIDSVLDNLQFSIPFTYERRNGKIYVRGREK